MARQHKTILLRGRSSRCWRAGATSSWLGLAFGTINAREAEVRRFVSDAGEYPWRWSPQLVDEWLGDQRAVRHLRQSTTRSKAITLRLSANTSSMPPTGVLDRFGTYPTQVCHDWNTATHVQEAEGRAGLRAFTTDEFQALFDCADELVVTTRKRGRKGWLSVSGLALGFVSPAAK